MEIKFLNQPTEVKLGDLIKKHLETKFDEVHLIAGLSKDSGFEEIFDSMTNSPIERDRISIYTGIDRKNTSKDVLLKLLDTNCNLSVHINIEENKIETRSYIFESEKNTSYMYVTGSKFSTGGLLENVVTFLEIRFDMKNEDDRKSFNKCKADILKGATAAFHRVDRDEIILLAEKGEIVARITERKIPRITEMYGGSGSGTTIGEQIYDESRSLLNINFDELKEVDVELEPGIVMRKNVELLVEKEAKKEKEEHDRIINSLKKSESDLDKFYGKTKTIEKKKALIKSNEQIDFENMTTLIIESNKTINKDAPDKEFKLPKSLSDKLDEFFKSGSVTFDFMDNADGNIHIDENTIITKSNDKGITLKSSVMLQLGIVEGDILRIIKQGDSSYKCEIIRQESAEYEIWARYCIHQVRGQKRKYGIN